MLKLLSKMIEPLRRGAATERRAGRDLYQYHLYTRDYGNSVDMVECATLHRLNFAFYFIVGA